MLQTLALPVAAAELPVVVASSGNGVALVTAELQHRVGRGLSGERGSSFARARSPGFLRRGALPHRLFGWEGSGPY